MRSLAVLILVLLLVPTVQAGELGGPVWGVKGGLSGSVTYGDDSGGMHMRLGGAFGATMEYPLTSLISFQGELLYAMKGWKNDKDFGGVEVNQTIGYVEIAPLLRLNSSGGGPGPYLIMGPVLGIKTNDKLEASAGSLTATLDVLEVKSTEFGFVLGGGVEFPGQQYTVFVEVRGDGGLTQIYDSVDLGGGVTQEWDVKSESASLLVGVSF
jgi:hypothetical protein